MKPAATIIFANFRHLGAKLATVVTLASAVLVAGGQNPGVPAGGSQEKSAVSEITTREKQPSFQLRVERNLVLVRVVVRDSKGQAVSNLGKENFQLFDNGKAQAISDFAMELAPAMSRPKAPAAPEDLEVEAEALVANRYVALYFDDVHLPFEDIARTREAAEQYLKSTLGPQDRAGIFTSSGQGNLDFTSSVDKLREALARLMPRPITTPSIRECPDIGPYQAYQIVNQRDPQALQAGVEDFIVCRCNGDRQMCPSPEGEVESAAMRVLSQDETQSGYSLRELERVVRRMATLPGQRSVVWVSPGFLSLELKYRLSEVVDRALRSKVIVNTLDSRGLYVADPAGDISQRPNAAFFNPTLSGWMQGHRLEELSVAADVLAEVAAGTGGVFFRNSNDFNEGFRRAGGLPEASYVLAFSPSNLRPNGQFHALKVRLINAPGLSAQARRGYFAPKELPDAKAQADEEIRDAAFSRDDLRELPVEIHTQFFKLNEREARLAVITRLDLRPLRFRKQDERNWNDIRIVTIAFDQDGNVVNAVEKNLVLRLRDATLEQLLASGLTAKSTLKVAPGTYLVRVVVRDSEGRQLSSLSQAVEIPY